MAYNRPNYNFNAFLAVPIIFPKIPKIEREENLNKIEDELFETNFFPQNENTNERLSLRGEDRKNIEEKSNQDSIDRFFAF